MTTPMQTEEHQVLFNTLTQHYRKNFAAVTGPLQKGRKQAWERFAQLGLPTNKNEVFRYVPLHALFAKNYTLNASVTISKEEIAAYIYPECSQSVIVFVNGSFQPQLSSLEALPKRLVITSLNDASGAYGAFLNNQWMQSLQEETDPFAAVNAALYRDGTFIYLPPKTSVEVPIQILHIIQLSEEAAFLTPRVHLFVGAHSQLSITTTIASLSGSAYCFNSATEITVEENAHVKYTQVAEELAAGAWVFDALRAHVKKHGSLKTISLTSGGASVRNDYRVTLTGEASEALLNGIWMLSEKRNAHANILMEHQAPHCKSMQKFKGVLNDFSRSSFEGKILVRQAAQKTEAYQLNNNLLLSDRAHADSKPNLEIFADDVKASHGATFGQLDADQLFYMRSRGFSEADAKNLLIYGFCKEIIDLITIPSLIKAVTDRTKRYLRQEQK